MIAQNVTDMQSQSTPKKRNVETLAKLNAQIQIHYTQATANGLECIKKKMQ